MHPKNVPVVIAAAVLFGAVLMVALHLSSIDLYITACVAVAAACGWVMAMAVNSNDVVTVEQFRETLNGIKAELAAHRQDHDVRAYNPKAVSTQLASLTASVTALENLVRSKLIRGKKSPTKPQPPSAPH